MSSVDLVRLAELMPISQGKPETRIDLIDDPKHLLCITQCGEVYRDCIGGYSEDRGVFLYQDDFARCVRNCGAAPDKAELPLILITTPKWVDL